MSSLKGPSVRLILTVAHMVIYDMKETCLKLFPIQSQIGSPAISSHAPYLSWFIG